MKTRIALAILLALSAAGAGYWLQHYQDAQGPQQRIDFALPDLDGQPQSARQWDGQVVVLNFWASWCPPCVREIPLLVELHRQYHSQGLQVVGIAVDRRDQAQKFADDLAIDYPVLHAVKPALELAAAYGNETGTLPYTVIIDRDGRIRATFPREVEPGELDAVVEPLL